MQCSAGNINYLNDNKCHSDITSHTMAEISNTDSSIEISQETGSVHSSSTALLNNELVLVTNDFCTNLPLRKPIEQNNLRELTLAEMGYDQNVVPNWESIPQPQKPDMKILLFDIIMKHDKTDVEILIDQSTFRCHMIVLQCYSEYFANIKDQKKIIVLPSKEVTPQAFYMIYQWMLSSDPTIDRKGITEFLKAAKYLKIESATSQCWACICDLEVVEDAAFLLYLEAREIGLIDVQKTASYRICKFFLIVVSSKDFLKLNLDEVVTFLSSNSIGVHSEMEVFFTALRWLFFNWVDRSKYLMQLMECVRFGHMTQSQLLLLKRNKEAEIANVVDDDVTKMIDDAISLHIVKMNINSEAFRNEPNIIEPVERQWLSQEEVEECFNYSDNASYRTFLNYLRYIRDSEPNYWNKFQRINACSNQEQFDNTQTADNRKGTSFKNNNFNFPSKQLETAKQPTDSKIDTEELFGNKIAEVSPTGNRIERDETSKDTKIIFRSNNFDTSVSTVSSTKSQTSKIIRYNAMVKKPLQTQNSSVSLSPTLKSNKFLRKKLSFNEFQLELEQSLNMSMLISKSSLYQHRCDTILVFGGLNPSSELNLCNNGGRQVFQYIPSKNRWDFVSLMPSPKLYHSAVIFQGRIYIAGGCTVSHLQQITTNSMLSFDPITLSWFKEKEIPVKIKNFGFVATHLQIYAIGGEDALGTPLNNVFRYDPVDGTWNSEEPMNFERSRAAVAIHKNHIWVAGGWTSTCITDSVEYFDPISGIWTEARSSLRVPRCFARMCSISGKLFIVGGINDDGHSIRSVDVYDEIFRIWNKIDDMEAPRHGHEIYALNSYMIIVGGSNSMTGEFVSEVECYCQSKMAWIDDFKQLPVPVAGMAGVVLPNC